MALCVAVRVMTCADLTFFIDLAIVTLRIVSLMTPMAETSVETLLIHFRPSTKTDKTILCSVIVFGRGDLVNMLHNVHFLQEQ